MTGWSSGCPPPICWALWSRGRSPGLLADRFGGSYVPAYGLFLLFLLVSMLLIQTVYRRTGAGGRPQH